MLTRSSRATLTSFIIDFQLNTAGFPAVLLKPKTGLAFFKLPSVYFGMQSLTYLAHLGFFFIQTTYQYGYLRNFKSNFVADVALVGGNTQYHCTLVSNFLALREAQFCVFSFLNTTRISPLNTSATLVGLVQDFKLPLLLVWYNVARSLMGPRSAVYAAPCSKSAVLRKA
jgi:hypothetical protein